MTSVWNLFHRWSLFVASLVRREMSKYIAAAVTSLVAISMIAVIYLAIITTIINHELP